MEYKEQESQRPLNEDEMGSEGIGGGEGSMFLRERDIMWKIFV